MLKTTIIAKGELYRYFISPIAYVYLICFLLLNGSLSLYFGGVFSSGNASLSPMFSIIPWIFLIFIPGIAMRLWSEEFKSGTIFQLMTLPVSVESLVWGKFLAAWFFCCLSLFLSFPFIITVNTLGSPDNGIIFSQYLGCILLSGAMLSISQTASSLTKNQVIALVLGVIINLLFFLNGLEYVLSFLRIFTPEYIINMISSFSFLTRINQLNAGILNLSNIIFFTTLIIMFNFFTVVIISFKTSGSTILLNIKSIQGCVLAIFLFFISFVGINLLADTTTKQFQVDFTEEHLFTPSESTYTILKNLQSPTTAKIYYSPILGERNKQTRQNFNNLILLLEAYQKISKGVFSYKIYNPEPLSDLEDYAIHANLQPIPVPDLNIFAYFGITLSNENGDYRSIPFIPNQRQAFLEQDLIENIYLLDHKRQTLGLLTSLPILGATKDNFSYSSWQIATELQKYYQIKKIKTPDNLQDIDILIIAHPQNMSKKMADAIYNFSINGGKILAFFDVAPESLRLAGPQTTVSQPSDYYDLPTRWGFHFYNDKVVADLYNSSQIRIETNSYSETTQDLIQFYLTPDSFFKGIPETTGLKRLLTTSASVFMPLKDAEISFIPLMVASKQSQLISSDYVFKNIHPVEILRQFKSDNKPKYIAAHILSKQREKNFELIVVGDSDLLYDSFWTTSIQVGNSDYSIPLLDNANFVLNALNVLSSDTSLLALRSKSPFIRPFTSIDQKQKQIIRDFRIKEKDVFDQINHIKLGLQEILNKRNFEERENFTPDELSIINKIEKELKQKKSELFNIRKDLDYNLKKIDFWVKVSNIYALPCLILITLLIYLGKHHKLRQIQKFKINNKFIYLGVFSFFCLLLGIISYINQSKYIFFDYEGTPLFPNLSNTINKVSQIEIKNKDNELIFTKPDKLWILKNNPDVLVNQNRIKSFLSALIQATIYEKKTNKIENIYKFGFLPIDNKNSETTFISLKNNQSNDLLSFEVGKYNIDLSRGAHGAYIRMPKQFQVWLANIDFIDLNTNYHYWSYTNLWNLQFGRFISINDQKDPSFVANIVKILLNTPFNSNTLSKINESAILSLKIHGEFFDNLVMSFYKHNQNFYVKYQFNGKIKNPILEKFAQISTNKFYQTPSQNVEKLINVVDKNSRK